MTPPRHLRPLLALAVAASVLGAGSALAAPKKVALGPNLVVNPSFEMSTSATDLPDPINFNPLPPTAWSYEGLTTLFDYHSGIGNTGKRLVIISGALGGGRQFCDGSSGTDKCTANPVYAQTHQVDEQTATTYSVRPFIVSADPIKVVAGKTYRFSTYAARPSLGPDSGVEGEGPATEIRWVDAAGKGLSVTPGASLLKTKKRSLGFKLITADLKAPVGAAGAVLMLGHSDYSHTGAQVAFDDVSFQQVG